MLGLKLNYVSKRGYSVTQVFDHHAYITSRYKLNKCVETYIVHNEWNRSGGYFACLYQREGVYVSNNTSIVNFTHCWYRIPLYQAKPGTRAAWEAPQAREPTYQ